MGHQRSYPPLEFVPCRGAWPPKPLFWGASGHQLCPQLSSMAPKNVRPSMADQERNRVLIMEKHRASMSMGGIAKALNLSKSTVQSVIRRFKDQGSVTRSTQKIARSSSAKGMGSFWCGFPNKSISHTTSGTCAT